MGKTKEFPRYNVFTLRLSDEALKALTLKARKSNQSKGIVANELLVKALGVEG